MLMIPKMKYFLYDLISFPEYDESDVGFRRAF